MNLDSKFPLATFGGNFDELWVFEGGRGFLSGWEPGSLVGGGKGGLIEGGGGGLEVGGGGGREVGFFIMNESLSFN